MDGYPNPSLPTNSAEEAFFGAFIPCADGGNGELALGEGKLHVLVTETLNRAGGAQFKLHFQPQGLAIEGLTTGDIYHATGVTQQTFTANAGQTITFVNNFRIIGPGTGNNFLVHELYHVTINANGELTVEKIESTVECK